MRNRQTLNAHTQHLEQQNRILNLDKNHPVMNSLLPGIFNPIYKTTAKIHGAII